LTFAGDAGPDQGHIVVLTELTSRMSFRGAENRVLRVMLHTRWSGEQWSVVMVEFRKAVALRGEIRRAGWFN
jgi:chorismate mutase